MANIKSQIKRIRTAERQRVRNKGVRSELKTVLKKFEAAIAEGDLTAAEAARRVAAKGLDRAASSGVIHTNKAANHKSAMALKLTKTAAAPPPAEETKMPATKRAAKKAPAAKAAAEATPEAAPKAAAAKTGATKPAATKKAAAKKAPAKKTTKKAAK